MGIHTHHWGELPTWSTNSKGILVLKFRKAVTNVPDTTLFQRLDKYHDVKNMKKVDQFLMVMTEITSPDIRSQLTAWWGHPSPRVIDTFTHFPTRHILHHFCLILKIFMPLSNKSRETDKIKTLNGLYLSVWRYRYGESLITSHPLQPVALAVWLGEQHIFLPSVPYRKWNIMIHQF